MFFISFYTPSYCRQQDYTDSLQQILNNDPNLGHEEKIFYLNEIAKHTSSPRSAIYFGNQLLRILTDDDLPALKIDAHKSIAVGYRMIGNLDKALEHLLTSCELALKNDEWYLLAKSYLEIGTTYTSNNDLRNALIYNRKAISIFRNNEKHQELAINLINTGYIYYELEKYDSALTYYNEAEQIFDSLALKIGKAYTIGNRALVYWKTGKRVKAKQDLTEAIELMIPLDDRFAIADYQNNLGTIYLEEKDYPQAIVHLTNGLELATELDLKEQISDAHQKLSQLYEATGETGRSLRHYKDFVAFRDSVVNLETVQKMANQQTEFEVNLRESEIATLEKDKQLQKTYIIISVILLLLSLVAILYLRLRSRNSRLLAEAQQKEHIIRVNDLLKSQETGALQAMLKGREQERTHLAKELHNHLGSLLATVKMNLNGLESPDQLKYNTIIKLVDQATQDVRNISHELNMGVSDDFGLLPALKELVNHLQKANQLEITLSAVIDRVFLDSHSEILIYRIVQELISNVLKHADATRLSVSLTGIEEGNLISIVVEDNGKGFDPDALSEKSTGIGLLSLREMVKKLDGELNIDSSSKRGTLISVDIPIEVPENVIES